MFDVIFLVEDKNDVIFLKDFILKNYCNSDIENAKYITEKEYSIEIGNKKILIRDTNKNNESIGTAGWSKIKNLIGSPFFTRQLQENEKTKFVAIFDGDEDKKENIGHKDEQINKWLNGMGFTIDRFYLPFNAKGSNNLEQLLELSFLKPFDDCWIEFVNCMDNIDVDANEPQSKKGKIIVYKDFYSVKPNEGYLSDKWNLDSNTNNNLQQLKSFLDTYL